jgi:hypothetical protein
MLSISYMEWEHELAVRAPLPSTRQLIIGVMEGIRTPVASVYGCGQLNVHSSVFLKHVAAIVAAPNAPEKTSASWCCSIYHGWARYAYHFSDGVFRPSQTMSLRDDVVNLEVRSHVELNSQEVNGRTFLLAFGRAAQLRLGVVLASELRFQVTCQQYGFGQFQWEGQSRHESFSFSFSIT